MNVDWDNVKYIFQLPMKWYRWIDRKVRHMYGADFISVKHDGYNDGIQVGVDYDSFAQEVRKIAGQPEDGWVKSVDSVGPDATGNVVTGSIKAIDSGSQTYYPDATGKVTVPFSSTVQTVDNIPPDTAGNIQLNAVRSVNQEYFPDENGNVYLPFSGTVKSVDGVGPDSAGNVSLGALTILDMANQGAIAGPSYTGDKPVSPMSHNHNMEELSGARDSSGNLTYVKSINTTLKPDSNGNVNINLPDTPAGTYLVASVDGIRPTDVSGNVVLSAVRSIKMNGTVYGPDKNGQVTLSAAAGGISSVTVLGNKVQPVDGNVDLGYIVYSVNGIEADEAGDVQLNIEDVPGIENYPTSTQVAQNISGSVAPITSALNNNTSAIYDIEQQLSGFLDSMDVETAGQIVGLDYESERFVCNVNHGHYPSDIEGLSDEYVTIGTEQHITGKKTFQNDVKVADVHGDMFVTVSPNLQEVSFKGDSPTLNFESQNTTGIIEADSNSLKIKTIFGTVLTPAIGGSLTFSSYDGTTLKQTGVSQPIVLDAGENKVMLANQPTDEDEDSFAVATVGYVQKHSGGTVKSVNGEEPDSSGNVKLDVVKSVNGQSPDSSGNVNVGTVKSVNGQGPDHNGNVVISTGQGTVKSVDGTYPDNFGNVTLNALTTLDVETAGKIVGLDYTSERFVCNVNHGHNGEDVGGMTAGKWVKTDASGYLTTTTDTPVSLPEGVSPASDGPSTFLVGVASQSTTTATFSRAQIYFTRGIATQYTPLTNQSIRVPQIPANVNPPTYFEYVYDAAYDGTNLFIKRYRMNTSGGALIGGQYLTDRVFNIGGGSSSGYNGTVSVVTGVSWDGTKLNISTGNMTITNGVITSYAAGATTNIDTVTYS